MGFFPIAPNDGDEIGPNTNGTYFRYVAVDNKWIIISNITISDLVYNASLWDANPDAATKNVIRDKIEVMETEIDGNCTTAEAHAYIEANPLTMENDIVMGSHRITGLTNGSAAQDAMAFGQKYTLEQHDNAYHSTNYEEVFSKNDAFNKNWGNVVGTVCQGNDSRIGDAYKIETKEVDTTGISDTKILKYNGTKWVIADDNTGGAGGDTDAIHDNVANEITAIALKTTPLNADELVIEDSEAGYVKKSVTVGSLPYSTLPIGFIAMFFGTWVDNSTIPGWYACTLANAAQGVPDLEDKFVRGGATSGGSGGSDNAIVVQHNHSASQAVHSHTLGRSNVVKGYNVNTINMIDTGGTFAPGFISNAQPTVTVNNAGVSGTGKNIPAYYALIFIMRVS